MTTIKQSVTYTAMTLLCCAATALVVIATSQGVRMPQPEVTPQAVVELLDEQCWTREQPADMAGKVPSFVLYQVGATGLRIGGTERVVWALERVERDETDGIHAFCR